MIAGALENGTLALWDAAKLKSQATYVDPSLLSPAAADQCLSSDALISSTTEHSGAIKALQFNPHRPELLASCGAKGELFVTDLNNPEKPYRVGTPAARSDSFDCLDWNKKVPHILVTGSSAGFVTVWDVKTKKESLTLNNYGRKPVSAVAWNPDVPTKLATAIPTDQDPLILLWDLRNSSAPEKILKGHDQGVLSIAWCPQDSDLFLSCGKDNRSICWNPHTAQILGEFAILTNWAFQIRWSPSHPNLCATASFDGKISVYNIQSSPSTTHGVTKAATQAVDGEDFFAQAQTHDSSTTPFSLTKPPKWMRRPVGASFGFGGKLVTFKTQDETSQKSSLTVSTFVADTNVESSISKFSNAIAGNDVVTLCDERINSAPDDGDQEEWKIFKALFSDSPRKALLVHLGFEKAVQAKEKAADARSASVEADDAAAEKSNGTSSKNENRLSSFFDSTGDGQSFLADLAASKGAKTNNPFSIFKGSESGTDKDITKALVLGSFEDALDLCLKENRISDAFMIAICGGQECIDKVQAAYFAQQSDGPNYLRLLASVVGKNLWDVVYNADLANWPEVMATLCTYADQIEFPDLCEALGDRLEESQATRKGAAFCYLAGSKLEKVVPIWIGEMEAGEKEAIKSAQESPFTIHVSSLQNFIQKVSVFRQATRYEDKEGSLKTSDWKLEPLYAKYVEYADIVASYGRTQLAEQYLSLLPQKYALADTARRRLQQATRSAAPTQNPRTKAAASAVTTPYQAPLQSYQPAAAANPSYAPSNAYAPTTTPVNSYNPTAPGYGHQPGAPVVGGPPPHASARPLSTAPPPSTKKADASNWNDLPENFSKPAVSRRGTPGPGASAVSSPFPNQPAGFTAHSHTFAPPTQQRATALPPPPKAGQAPPSITSPLADRTASPVDPMHRPPSSAASAYAPTSAAPQYGAPPSSSMSPPALAPPVRGASPYNAPPSAAPPSNRYAPAPGAPSSSFTPSGPLGAAGRPPVAPNPYSPAPQNPLQTTYGPPGGQAPPRGPPPGPSAPPRGSIPPPPLAQTSQPSAGGAVAKFR